LNETTPTGSEETGAANPPKNTLVALWGRTPLYVRIVVALALGAIVGFSAQAMGGETAARVAWLKEVSGLVLALLRALATPLILLAILNALLRTQIGGSLARRMAFYLITNTLAAICIGLLVANIIRPGNWGGNIGRPSAEQEQTAGEKKAYDPFEDIKSKIPTNIIKPLYDDNVIAVIILAVTFGVALRKVREGQIAEGKTEYKTVEGLIGTLFAAVMTALHWIIQLVPIAVFCVVAAVIAKEGIAPFQALGGFIVAVLLALALQVAFYLTRVRFGSWVSPKRFLMGGKDAFLTAFSTASSTITMPITYEALRDKKKVGVRDNSASMGALVGGPL
jgi:Na+/H+-dicarboxylate symporter